jgi:3-oxoacyl-[acyl-carrier protein] reductase
MATALITGVGRPNGIAAALAQVLAADGWDLGIHWFDEDPSHLLGDLHSVRVTIHQDDLADKGAPGRLFDAVEASLSPVTALAIVHTRCVPAGLEATSSDEFDRHWAINVRASLLLIQEFARRFRGQAGSGRIVAFTSDHFTPENLAYGVTKAALDKVILAAAFELGSRGISANAINPGGTDTGWMNSAIYEGTRNRTPLGRVGLPEDAARLARWLLSDEGAWVSGQVLYSNGAAKFSGYAP